MTVVDALSHLNIDSLKIQDNKEEVLKRLRIRKQQHHQYQVNIPNAYSLDLQRKIKVNDLGLGENY
jgi:hypothetical protein